MKVALILALCVSQAYGSPYSWTSIPISDPVVVNHVKPFVQTRLGLVITFLDTAAREVS